MASLGTDRLPLHRLSLFKCKQASTSSRSGIRLTAFAEPDKPRGHYAPLGVTLLTPAKKAGGAV